MDRRPEACFFRAESRVRRCSTRVRPAGDGYGINEAVPYPAELRRPRAARLKPDTTYKAKADLKVRLYEYGGCQGRLRAAPTFT
jgi:hypothetical protein